MAHDDATRDAHSDLLQEAAKVLSGSISEQDHRQQKKTLRELESIESLTS